MKIDLHIHTNQSDGTYSPEDIVKEAIALNLRCIAITDHDTTSGILSAQSVAKKYASNLKIINGIELSTELNGKSVHILGYHIDIDNKELRSEERRVGKEC